MSEIEANYIKAVKFKKVPEDFEDRQEYLRALVKKLDGMNEEMAEQATLKLSEEAFDWYEGAVAALNAKEDVPDFADAEPEEEATEEESDAGEEPEAKEVSGGYGPDVIEPDESDGEPEEGLDTGTEEEPEEPDTDSGPAEAEAETGTEAAEAAEEAEPAKPKKGKAKKAAKPAKKEPKKKARVVAKNKVDYTKISGEKDRFGITMGTQMARAIKMFEKGATMKEIEEETGDTQYTLLRRMKDAGHKVEKDGSKFKVTHKDDAKKGKGK